MRTPPDLRGVLVASRFAVRVAWSRLPEPLRSRIRVRKGPRFKGTFLTPLDAAGAAWVYDAARRFGVRRWTRAGWTLEKPVKGLGRGIQ